MWVREDDFILEKEENKVLRRPCLICRAPGTGSCQFRGLEDVPHTQMWTLSNISVLNYHSSYLCTTRLFSAISVVNQDSTGEVLKIFTMLKNEDLKGLYIFPPSSFVHIHIRRKTAPFSSTV